MFDWINASLNRKIGSILAVSLSFLLVVIGYSIYQVRSINAELKDVSRVDLPLTSVITEVEMLQLQQHLSMEHFRLLMGKGNEEQDPIASFSHRHQTIVRLLDQATQLVSTNINNDTIQFKPEEYQRILDEIHTFSIVNQSFEQQLESLLGTASLSEEVWADLEATAANLDKNIVSILEQINQLTLEATRYTEEHQQSFLLVETGLGICAFILSTLLAAYVIQVMRSRIDKIHQQVEQLHTSLEQGGPIARPDNHNLKASDELSELELDLKKMIARLSDEMNTRQEFEQQLIQLATKDKLTNTYNRHKWTEQIQLLINFASQDKTFSLVSLDVDHFKKINDTYGHQVGDKVLQRLADLLQKNLKKTDMVFRMGGEEFMVLLIQQDLAEASAIAERLRNKIASYQEENLPTFTASMGVTEYNLGETEDSLMTRVDEALYQSKKSGRNCITWLE
ncbi:GGDEF domain-containing protein [Marinomonas transparens]|uniref:diguanylate cyclase n=1 Tax=Marinomonas transparens TaxID=2795388 RepID=A0A934JY50_9GAMM|nr:GGDEF domain-containing protein [Marinomonas transparens]MBJ7539390.1 GGDEF domain-containing protein [Marinomonas transparens]